MKKSIITIIVLLLGIMAQAQIKVHQNGWVSIGTLSGAWDQGFQFVPGGCAHFNHSATTGWPWVTMSSSQCGTSKNWIVSCYDKYDQYFYVTGYGVVCYTGLFQRSATSNNTSGIVNPNGILDGITGYYYEPSYAHLSRDNNESKVGLLAEDVKEVLPEAVFVDDNELLYIDYNAITAVLVEAVKSQQKEIGRLRKALEDNGITIPDE